MKLDIFPKTSEVIKDAFSNFYFYIGTVVLTAFIGIDQVFIQSEFTKLLRYKLELGYILIFLIILGLIWRLFYTRVRFRYDSGTLEVDRQYFKRFHTQLFTQEILMIPRHNTYSANSFESDELFNLLRFLEEKDKSDFEFLNPELNKLKVEFMETLENLYNTTRRYVCGDYVSGWLNIPREWSYEEKQRAREEIEREENALIEKYDELIRKSRIILKVC